MVASAKSVFKYIPMDKIDRPAEGTRLEIREEEIEELAQSIAERGQLQPILITPRNDRFEIVAGDRRYLAHKKLGREEIEAKVVEADKEAVAIDRATENLQRRDLSPFEEGMIYAGLSDELGMTQREIAKKMGKSLGCVNERIGLLNMPEEFQKAIHFGKVSLSVAGELMRCPDEGKRMYFLEMAVENGITIAVARMWVDDFNKSLRLRGKSVEGGSPPGLAFDTSPIYRACDVCRGPVEFKDVVELRVCPGCDEVIQEAMRKPTKKEGG